MKTKKPSVISDREWRELFTYLEAFRRVPIHTPAGHAVDNALDAAMNKMRRIKREAKARQKAGQ